MWIRVLVASGTLLLVAGCAGRDPGTGPGPGPGVGSPSPVGADTRSGCGPRPTLAAGGAVQIDYVDIVVLGGVHYIAGLGQPQATAAPGDLGTAVGTVRCQLSALSDQVAPGPLVDGDAALLPEGTAVRAVRGFPPTCRVAAMAGGRIHVYLAQRSGGGVSRPVPCAVGR